MRKNLLMLGSLVFSIGINAQDVLTFVGNNASLTVKSGALVYSGGGWQNAGNGKVSNEGDVMVVAPASGNDVFDIASGAEFRLKWLSSTDYGQLYITDLDQSKIAGKVVKEYQADANNGSDPVSSDVGVGRQQVALPFYNLSVTDLTTIFPYLQTASSTLNSSGRFNYASAFRWNNKQIRFDQITNANSGTSVGKATDYYIIPRRNGSNVIQWDADNIVKDFVGTPYSSYTHGTANFTLDILDTGYISDLGSGGNKKNIYAERYNSYVNDPFVDGTVASNWESGGNYGKNLSQFANPFLTNLDLYNLKTNTSVLDNITGIAYYGSNDLDWYYADQSGSGGYTGTLYRNGNVVMSAVSGGVIQTGDLGKMIIKPMGEVMVKLANATSKQVNLNDARSFSQVARTASNYGPTNKGVSIPADKIVKQVSVTLYNMDGKEVGKTHYAVSPSAVTGRTGATMQGFVADYPIYTKEEKADGGEDSNYTSQLYINEANELNFEGKKIPMFINFDAPATMKFEVFEGGEKIEPGQQLSTGSFYLEKDNNVVIKINSGDSISVTQASYGLYFGEPQGATLGTGSITKNQTVIAKKDNDWVIRFSKDWKKAKIEVYSATGQLIHIKNDVNTGTDYVIPILANVNGVFVVKTTSEAGEVVIKKIVK